MPSELTQMVGMASAQQTVLPTQAGKDGSSSTTAKDMAHLNQVAASQAIGQLKAKDQDAEKVIQTEKRTEQNFSTQRDKPDTRPTNILKKKKPKNPDGKLDVVA